MSKTARGLAIAAVAGAFALVGTLAGNRFGDPLLWSASGGVIGALIGVVIFRKR